MAKKVKKKFNKSYNLLLEQAYLMHFLLSEDILLFTEEFPSINNQFLNTFENAIKSADEFPQDDGIKSNLVLSKLDADKIMRTARNRISRLYKFIEYNFEDDPDMTENFGKNLYRKARSNQSKLVELLALAYSKAMEDENHQPLLDKGFSQEKIDELDE